MPTVEELANKDIRDVFFFSRNSSETCTWWHFDATWKVHFPPKTKKNAISSIFQTKNYLDWIEFADADKLHCKMVYSTPIQALNMGLITFTRYV